MVFQGNLAVVHGFQDIAMVFRGSWLVLMGFKEASLLKYESSTLLLIFQSLSVSLSQVSVSPDRNSTVIHKGINTLY